MARKLPPLSRKSKAKIDHQNDDFSNISNISELPDRIQVAFWDQNKPLNLDIERRKRDKDGKMIFPYDYIIEIMPESQVDKKSEHTETIFARPEGTDWFFMILRSKNPTDLQTKLESIFEMMQEKNR